MTYAVEVKNLTKHYPGANSKALDSIDLKIKKNSFLALLGKNGAGKSTFIGILSSLIRKTSGSVSVLGYDLEKDETIVKSIIGIVPQEFNLPFFDKSIDILVNHAGYYGVDRKTATTRAKKYLSILHLLPKQNEPSIKLSGGMKRRLMLARAIMHDPQIIFLDEPTAGVDVEVRAIIWDFLKALQAEGKTIILTTHYLEEAEMLCDSIAILKDGEIILHGDMSEILDRVSKSNLLIDGIIPTSLKKKDFGVFSKNIEIIGKKRLKIEIDKSEQSLNDLLTHIIKLGIKITNIRNTKSDLEGFL